MVYSIFLKVWFAFCHVSNRFSAMQLNSGSAIFTFKTTNLGAVDINFPLPSLHIHRGKRPGCQQWWPLCHPLVLTAASSLDLDRPWFLNSQYKEPSDNLGWLDVFRLCFSNKSEISIHDATLDYLDFGFYTRKNWQKWKRCIYNTHIYGGLADSEQLGVCCATSLVGVSDN